MSAVVQAGAKAGSAAKDVKRESGTARLLGSGQSELPCAVVFALYFTSMRFPRLGEKCGLTGRLELDQDVLELRNYLFSIQSIPQPNG